jgi:PAS domain S-box-containing protein
MPNHGRMTTTSLFQDAGALARVIAEASDDVIFAKDLQGRYQFANPAALAALGLPLDKVLGHDDRQVLGDGAVARRRMANDQQVLATGQAMEFDEAVPQADGSTRHWQSRKVPLRAADGTLAGLVGIARDVTSRKRTETDREAALLKVQMAIQAAGLVMAEIDYRSNENHISAELARLMELGDTDMVVPRQAIFDRIHPDDRDRYLAGIARTLDPAGNGHLAIDVRALVPSGAVRWLHIRLQVTFTEQDGERRPERGICAARDVTAKVEADRRKDEFIAMLAHELRNPLAPIRNGLEILRRSGELPPAAMRTRDMMERQLNHMVRLVDDLLDVSRISRGKLELRLAPLTLQQVVEHATEATQPAVAAAGHVLALALPDAPIHLHGDLTRLAQVVSNLVHNATKYTPRGGRITVRGRVEDGQALLDVEDDGEGIAPETLPHVFDLFAQADAARQGGLGIGLFLVRRLVQMHGGDVTAASAGPGHGSRFTVRLPLAG